MVGFDKRQLDHRFAVVGAYGAYGLRIHSDIPLPELFSIDPGLCADVDIHLGSIRSRLLEADGCEEIVHGDLRDAYIFVPSVGAIHVSHGCEIMVNPVSGVEDRVIRLFLLGAALGLLLHQRGLLTLHASAVAINDGAVLFLGNSGQGKSTLAATLNTLGYPLVADDVVAIDMCGTDGPVVLPAYPQLKLWPDAATAIGNDPSALPLLHPDLTKRWQPAAGDFSLAPLPLRHIYALYDADEIAVEQLHPREAFAETVAFAYAVGLLGPSAMTPSHFQQYVALAERVPVYVLERPRSLAMLSAVATLIARHCGEE